MATIEDGRRKIPFLRGMLTQYLIGQGVKFKDAYRVADEVRSSIQKRKSVSASRMVELIHEHSRKLLGDQPIGDGVFWASGQRQIMVVDDDGTRPFSQEHLTRSFGVTGIDETEAYRIAERISADFISQRKSEVSRDEIFKTAFQALARDAGEAFAERYWIRNWFRSVESSRPLVVLIGGASGVGKTTVGVALANQLRVSRVVSTDAIRQVMRLMISEDLMPAIHRSSYTAWQSSRLPLVGGADPVIAGYREQVTRVSVGVLATINRSVEENVNLVVDGIHLLPDLLSLDDLTKNAYCIPINLYLDDSGPFEERFKMRGDVSKRKQRRYLDHMGDILKIQRHILEVGEAHKVPAVENSDLDEAVQTITLHIMDTLRDVAAPKSVRRQLSDEMPKNGNGNGKKS